MRFLGKATLFAVVATTMVSVSASQANADFIFSLQGNGYSTAPITSRDSGIDKAADGRLVNYGSVGGNGISGKPAISYQNADGTWTAPQILKSADGQVRNGYISNHTVDSHGVDQFTGGAMTTGTDPRGIGEAHTWTGAGVPTGYGYIAPDNTSGFLAVSKNGVAVGDSFGLAAYSQGNSLVALPNGAGFATDILKDGSVIVGAGTDGGLRSWVLTADGYRYQPTTLPTGALDAGIFSNVVQGLTSPLALGEFYLNGSEHAGLFNPLTGAFLKDFGAGTNDIDAVSLHGVGTFLFSDLAGTQFLYMEGMQNAITLASLPGLPNGFKAAGLYEGSLGLYGTNGQGQFVTGEYTASVTAVPEPGTLLLFATGMVAMVVYLAAQRRKVEQGARA